MTATELDKALAESMEEVLETMFFTTVLDDAPWISGGVAARLAFRGDPSGVFTVAASEGAARSLAASFLALEEDEVPGERIVEVVRELANMLCGSALSRLEPDKLFELGRPEAVLEGFFDAMPPGTWRAADIGSGAVVSGIELGA